MNGQGRSKGGKGVPRPHAGSFIAEFILFYMCGRHYSQQIAHPDYAQDAGFLLNGDTCTASISNTRKTFGDKLEQVLYIDSLGKEGSIIYKCPNLHFCPM